MTKNSVVGRTVGILIALASATAWVGLGAQTVQGNSQNIPTGSPLQGNQQESTSQSNDDDDRSNDAVIQTTPVERTTIETESRAFSQEELTAARRNRLDQSTRVKRAEPNEFELYVQRLLGRRLPRFGEDLILPAERDFATPATATVPPDYILNVGDVVAISMTGSIEGSVERTIDTDGRIFLPKVGSIRLAGVRYGDLRDTVSAAIGRQYRGYTVTAGINKLRGVRIYVTGFANNPGAFTVNSLSTMANAVFSAGGPAAGGSFRSIKLYRNGAEVADFDLYELVRGGSRVNDAILQNEDVLFIPPVGPQVAVIGSVSEEAIYESKPGETLETLLAFAGGTNTLGDASRLILYRTNDPTVVGPQQINRTAAANVPVAPGDILQILSKGSLTQPVDRQSVMVRIEGEVNRPGNYFVAPNTPMSHVLELAGGLTPRASAYGTKLQRTSVRAQQRESFKEAIEQLELTLAAAPLTADTSQAEGDRNLQLAGARSVLERLRKAEPDGRVVMNIHPDSTTLPADILLENNDQIVVPVRSTTVGVFGAVYRPASFLMENGRKQMRVKDYVERAGGAIRAADRNGIFVVRANGEVLSKRRGALSARVLPGDVIFVPVKTQSASFWTKLREISTTLFQIGLSTATVASLTK